MPAAGSTCLRCAVFPLLINTYEGVKNADRLLINVVRSFGANEWQIFWNVTLPALQPIMMILIVLRFGTSMAVIDEYLIFGGFDRASPTYTWTIFMYDQALTSSEICSQ